MMLEDSDGRRRGASPSLLGGCLGSPLGGRQMTATRSGSGECVIS